MSSMFCLIYYSLKLWRYVEISIIAVRATEVNGRTINVVVQYSVPARSHFVESQSGIARDTVNPRILTGFRWQIGTPLKSRKYKMHLTNIRYIN